MKIYPDLQKIWAKRIREAGMTKNQAKKVIDESAASSEKAKSFLENPSTKPKNTVNDILKRLNIF